ncbi:MAG TPA: AI-2E family transporter [Acetobacteraceae bacterium]|jgi:predicted PurR-regulated permease PerM|nr:AI-2E family transporter [Acetobacteraceae bacterium]
MSAPAAAKAIEETVDNATETVRAPEPAVAHEGREAMPLPTEPRTIFLGGLFILALLAALYVASPIVLPVVLAIVLKLFLQPVVRLTDRLGVPHGVGAALAIALLVLGLAALISGVAGPAASWAGKLPEAIPKIQQQLAFLTRPIESLGWMLGQLQDVTGVNGGLPQGPSHSVNVMGALFSGTTTAAAGLFTTLVVLFFLLVSGETFMRRFVEILPSFAEKRQAVEITLDIERNISAYLITVTLINLVVGTLTFCVMWATGVANPLLWGLIAFAVNFVPILGPMVAMVIFLMAGVLSLGVTWWALLPVGLYVLIHVIEGEIVTPMLLARRFTINPVAVILALLFWYWMWGVPGAILAVPMLAITKIVCDDLTPLRAFGHFLEG